MVTWIRVRRMRLLVGLLGLGVPAFADPGPPAAPGPMDGRELSPRIHHGPTSVATANEPLEVLASIDFPHLVGRALLVYRPLVEPTRPFAEWRSVVFLRSAPGPYVAIVPEAEVKQPGLEYAIELERVDGRREAVFASRQAPHRVSVGEDLMDLRERAALERFQGRRSTVSTFAEYVSFGESAAATSGGDTEHAADWYYRIEGAYTFRPLRFIDEFSVHVGVVRGHSPRSEPDTRDVGLNYAAPSARVRLGEVFRLEGTLLTSVTEEGFSLGTGGALDVGDPYGSKLRVGFETIRGFGTKLYGRVDLQATPGLRLSPMIEATNMPHAERYGVRLTCEAAYTFPGGFAAALGGGYQARDAASGGPSAGLGLGYSF